MKKISKYILTEGKHWPEDYVKTAFNTIKNSELGKQNWYTDNYINQDLKTFVSEFGPLSHKNSNLGYFATIIRWFIEFVGKDVKKYQEFVERKLDGIIRTLLWLSNNPGEESKIKNQIKTKWKFENFEKFQKSIEDRINAEQTDKMKNVKFEDKGYEIIKINSYQQLHEKFGGNKTGYKGKSEWCHTNGESTYESWTENGKYNLFVIVKKGWEKIEPPDPETTNAYDEYGTSLIAILVNVASGELMNATLRWNHTIDPSKTKPGTSSDKAFLGWADLAEVTGMNVEREIKIKIKESKIELEKKIEQANKNILNFFKSYKEQELNRKQLNIIRNELNIASEIKIPNNIKSIGDRAFFECGIKSVVISDSVTRIGYEAFSDCRELESIVIPDSVITIDRGAFRFCDKLHSVTIPNNITKLEDTIFAGCFNLKSITIPASVESIGQGSFSVCGFKSIIIANTVKSIKEAAFQRCVNLTSIILPNTIDTIDTELFNGCNNLASFIVPNSVKYINNFSFNGCRNLIYIIIPDSVIDIGNTAFNYCDNLKTIYCSEKIWNKFRNRFLKDAVRKDPSEAPKNESKSFKIKNYKGNLIESLEKFSKRYNLKIVKVSEDGNELKIKTL